MMKEKVTYWCKSVFDKGGGSKIIEIYLGEDGLFRVYVNRSERALVFGSWEAIYERFPLSKREVTV